MSSSSPSRIASWLYLSAVITVIAGIVFGLTITPVFFALAAVGLFDGVLAYLFASGRLGGNAAGEPAAAGEPTQAESDPSYNPYARED